MSTGHMRFFAARLVPLLVATHVAAQSAPWAKPHVFAGFETGHDDQPITFERPTLAAWMFVSDWTSIGAKASATRFALSDTASRTLGTVSATLSQTLWRGRATLDAEIGALTRTWATSSDGVGSARVTVKPVAWATITAAAEHFAYTSTEQSLSAAVMPTRYSADFAVSTPSGWMGDLAYQVTRFASFGVAPSGVNDVTAKFGWVLAPVPGVTPGVLQLGYSVSASNSTRLMYELQRPSQPFSPTSPNFDFTGVYAPYYTPRDQLVHSALAAVTVSRGALSFHANGAFGFHATENAPHIVALTPTPRAASTQVVEAPRAFNPWNARATLTSAVRKNLSLVLSGEALRTAFYTAETASVSLDYTIAK